MSLQPEDIFIIAGQSNAANYVNCADCNGHSTPQYQLKHPQDVLVWNLEKGQKVCDKYPSWCNRQWELWQPASAPLPSFAAWGTSNCDSVWPRVGDMLFEQTGRKIGFVFFPWGGTSVSQWVQTANNLFIAFILAAQQLLPTYASKIRAILWFQGETDAATGMSTSVYAGYLTQLIQESRQSGLYPTVPWLVSRTTLGAPDSNRQAILDAQNQVIRTTPNTFSGPDTDELAPLSERYEQLIENRCTNQRVHMTEIGAEHVAAGWVDSIMAANVMTQVTQKHQTRCCFVVSKSCRI